MFKWLLAALHNLVKYIIMVSLLYGRFFHLHRWWLAAPHSSPPPPPPPPPHFSRSSTSFDTIHHHPHLYLLQSSNLANVLLPCSLPMSRFYIHTPSHLVLTHVTYMYTFSFSFNDTLPSSSKSLLSDRHWICCIQHTPCKETFQHSRNTPHLSYSYFYLRHYNLSNSITCSLTHVAHKCILASKCFTFEHHLWTHPLHHVNRIGELYFPTPFPQHGITVKWDENFTCERADFTCIGIRYFVRCKM